MNATLNELKNAATALPLADRAELAQVFLRSLDEVEESDVRAEWLAMAVQRMAEIKAGIVVGIPAEDVLKTLPGQRK